MKHRTAALCIAVASALLLLAIQQAVMATEGTRVKLTVRNLPIGG